MSGPGPSELCTVDVIAAFLHKKYIFTQEATDSTQLSAATRHSHMRWGEGRGAGDSSDLLNMHQSLATVPLYKRNTILLLDCLVIYRNL